MPSSPPWKLSKPENVFPGTEYPGIGTVEASESMIWKTAGQGCVSVLFLYFLS
jgi:hypothetical protein